ncbi:hypothetical protein IV417_05510 [Alphaproteobacteria bacterium KMM 3653]|uniref:Uncharacterized protein n=1 Tax=Harenicola maris TaxID=2841044 RepID=A0AAP2G3H8_9RHOB|nr:hypothetical protein [Harenicola maris]
MTTASDRLKEICQHPDYPFRGWEKNDLEFLMLELFWAEFVNGVLGDELAHYGPWFDGQRDGNPILHIVNRRALYGLRVIVLENEDNLQEFPQVAGVGTYYPFFSHMNWGYLPDGETKVNELVIVCRLDENFALYEPDIKALMQRHCVDYAPHEELEAMQVDLEGRYRMAEGEEAYWAAMDAEDGDKDGK